MTIERLRLLLDTWGAASERWPATERAAALALIARSPDARALRDEAVRLDALLDADPADAPSDALVARVLAAAPAPPRARVVRPVRWLVPLAMAAGLAAVWLGRSVAPPASEPLPIAALGVYEVGSDALLSVSDAALADDDAWTTCPDDELDCPIEPPTGDAHSSAHGRTWS